MCFRRPTGLRVLPVLVVSGVHLRQQLRLSRRERPGRGQLYPLLRQKIVSPAVSAAFRLMHLRWMAAAQPLQLVQQRGIVRVDAGGLLCFVEQDLSEKNNYPSKSEEYMANQVFYQIFFG